MTTIHRFPVGGEALPQVWPCAGWLSRLKPPPSRASNTAWFSLA
jgi:hypothetical protein